MPCKRSGRLAEVVYRFVAGRCCPRSAPIPARGARAPERRARAVQHAPRDPRRHAPHRANDHPDDEEEDGQEAHEKA